MSDMTDLSIVEVSSCHNYNSARDTRHPCCTAISIVAKRLCPCPLLTSSRALQPGGSCTSFLCISLAKSIIYAISMQTCNCLSSLDLRVSAPVFCQCWLPTACLAIQAMPWLLFAAILLICSGFLRNLSRLALTGSGSVQIAKCDGVSNFSYLNHKSHGQNGSRSPVFGSQIAKIYLTAHCITRPVCAHAF